MELLAFAAFRGIGPIIHKFNLDKENIDVRSNL
jgi:hypothetical protein